MCALVFGGTLGGTLVFQSGEARADAPAAELHLGYEAPAGCPTRSDFLAALSPRIQASWVEGADTRSFDVRIRREGNAFVGRLVIGEPDQPPNTREIRGATCKAVTMSLVVFVAIALDPATAPRAEEPEVKPQEPAEPPPSPLPPPAPRTRPRKTRASPPRPPPVIWTWSSGVDAVYLRAPEPSWGARVHIELMRSHELDRIAPALRLSWGWADFSTRPEQAGKVSFRLKTARIEAGARAMFGPVRLGAFLGFDGGTMTGVAADLPRFEEIREPWRAWTGSVRAGVSVAPWLALELSGTLVMPFERPRFELQEPVRSAYKAPAVLFEGTAGIVAVARFQ
ncbi:hypothetical protein AKJ09_04481 [Labilithrix luteola]|uniref:Uncharacterized protein n=2 Tax=Labilithrix luteola TaxID=1391654 RepID=A0A0K1PWC4_9BACT|nr:hypothetical protein AKJ09_04481 [Labilithrix luteola]